MIYGPNDNGVTYELVPSGSPDLYDLTIAYPNHSSQSYPDIHGDNILFTDGSILRITSDPIEVGRYVVPPGVEGTITIVTDLDSDNIFHIGGTATLDIGANFLSGTTVNVDGGAATLTNGVVADALSGTTINLNNGAVFGNGTGVITALSNTIINFAEGGGTFLADSGGHYLDFSSTILAGFDAGKDHLQFSNLPSGTVLTTYNITNDAGGRQTIVAYDGGTEALRFVVAGGTFEPGTYATNTGPLGFSEDGASVIVTACFLAGTMVATPDGPVAIETLEAGDLVLTHEGAARPVRWLAVQTIAKRSLHADPTRVLPIRIARGALDETLPAQDLYVSPDHALLLDGCLVQAGALVNGTTITRHVRAPQTFLYYHVELSDHSLILVEGVAAETFVDHVTRRTFDNWHEAPEAPGSIPEIERPRVKSSRQVPRALRERIAARAQALLGDVAQAA